MLGWNERHRRLMEILAKSFVVAEQRTSCLYESVLRATPKLVTLKRGGRTLIKEIRCVEGAISEELKRGTVPLVAADWVTMITCPPGRLPNSAP